MINLSDDIMIIKKDVFLNELRNSLKEVKNMLVNYYKLIESPTSLNGDNKKYAYIVNFTDEKISSLYLDEQFIQECLQYSMDVKHQNVCVDYGFCDSNILLHKPYYRSAMKFVLLSLWKKKIILLPLWFNIKINGFTDEFMTSFDNELITMLKNEENLVENTRSAYFNERYMPTILKIIRTTDYSSYNDVSIDEVNSLHIQILKSKNGKINSKIPNVNYYIEEFLLQIKEKVKDFDFETFEYKQWLLGFDKRHVELNYKDYKNSKDELVDYRLNYVNEQSKVRHHKNKIALEKELERDFNIIKDNTVTFEDEFFNVIEKRHNWLNSVPFYPGYSFEVLKDSELWRDVFGRYLEHRRKNGYETERIKISTFNFLMNYIFFYLNLWKSNNDVNFKLPLTPKDFHRTFYVNNSSLTIKKDLRPLTIVELLDKKYSNDSRKNSILLNIQSFFSFISDFYSENLDVWDSKLKNPIRKSDFYKETKNKKTNKVIIPKNTYSKLKKYLICLEDFGNYLLEKSLNSDLSIPFIKTQNIKTAELGYVPIFYDNGKVYPLLEVPNVYSFRTRKFDVSMLSKYHQSSEVIEKRIPCNTAIRSLILMLNTGLRAAQVLWLDKFTWNMYINKDELNAYYKMNVNTDKTKNNEWCTYISHNVYKSLTAEMDFQNAMREPFMEYEINYQNRDLSRFKKIMPLFRGNASNGLPIDFRQYWVDVLWHFQNLINNQEDKIYELIEIKKPQLLKIDVIGNERLKYCPLIIRAIHTPHSMRATFCTHMSEYLERSEIASLVGHASDLITSEVYIKPEEDVLKDKIKAAIDIFDGVNSDYFDNKSSVHVKPHLAGSSLQKAFSENRDQTIELFNITSLSLNVNKDSEEQSLKAIKLLKDARMDQIIFDTTHICPVGGMCPQEVMNIIGEKRRCGLCPLALKCIDNLNPIYAKQRDLIREIKNGKEQLDLAVKNKDSEISIHNIEDKVNLDIRELVSWKFSSDILSAHYEELKNDLGLGKKYFVEMPDMVKSHLTKVSVANEKEYLLTRLADANVYTSYNNPENKYKAEMLRRDIIKNIGIIEYDDYYVSDDDKIETFCAMIKNMMDSNGVNLKNLVEYDCFKYIENQKRKEKKLVFNQKIKLIK
jgi:hypothetical protein